MGENTEARLQQLERRIQELEDANAIRELKARYCHACDDDHNPDAVAVLFTEDCVWEGKGIGRAQGQAELRTLFEGFRQAIAFSMHMTMNPVIKVHGDSATGVWYMLGPFTMTDATGAPEDRWQATRYEERYVRTPEGWKIAHLKVCPPGFSAPYLKGWRKQRR